MLITKRTGVPGILEGPVLARFYADKDIGEVYQKLYVACLRVLTNEKIPQEKRYRIYGTLLKRLIELKREA